MIGHARTRRRGRRGLSRLSRSGPPASVTQPGRDHPRRRLSRSGRPRRRARPGRCRRRTRRSAAGRPALLDHANSQAGRVPLAGQHADQPPKHRVGRREPFRPQPAGNQRPGRLLLGAGSSSSSASSTAPRRRPCGAAPRRAPGARGPRRGGDGHPGPGERGVVDHADLVVPVEDPLDHLVGHVPAAQRVASSARVAAGRRVGAGRSAGPARPDRSAYGGRLRSSPAPPGLRVTRAVGCRRRGGDPTR